MDKNLPQLIQVPEKKIIFSEPKLVSLEDEIKRKVGEAYRTKAPMSASLLAAFFAQK